jgi:hypothetical protein
MSLRLVRFLLVFSRKHISRHLILLVGLESLLLLLSFPKIMRDEVIHQNEVSRCICFDELYKFACLILSIALLRLDKKYDWSSVHLANLTSFLPHTHANCLSEQLVMVHM